MKRSIRIFFLVVVLLAMWIVARSTGSIGADAASAAHSMSPLGVASLQDDDVNGELIDVDDDDDDDDGDDDDITPHLTVRGEAELDKPADQLRLSLGVLTEGPDAEETLERNSELIQDVLDAVKKVGLAENEYSTGRFRVQPVYSRRPRNADEGWTPKITGFQVSNTLDIKTKQLDLAGRLIQEANKAGANSVHAISFELANPRTHRAEAIETATANAIADAKVVSKAAGVSLKRVISISVDDARPVTPPPSRGVQMRAMAEGGGVSTPIAPGEVTVKASVTIVYEIEQ